MREQVRAGPLTCIPSSTDSHGARTASQLGILHLRQLTRYPLVIVHQALLSTELVHFWILIMHRLHGMEHQFWFATCCP